MLRSAAGAERRRRRAGRPVGHLLLLHRHTRHTRNSLAPLPSALEHSSPCHAAQFSSAAATSPPPWLAQGKSRLPHLSRASAPGESPQCIPLTRSSHPRPKSPEDRRHPPACRRARADRRPATPAASPPIRDHGALPHIALILPDPFPDLHRLPPHRRPTCSTTSTTAPPPVPSRPPPTPALASNRP